MKNSKGMTSIIILILVIASVVAGYFYFFRDSGKTEGSSVLNLNKKVSLTRDYEGAKVPVEDISQGCLGGQDCIPSIDSPIYELVSEGDSWLNPDDVVFGVIHKDEIKAYPQRIMNWHEIVNDTFAGDPIAVTFCPLCGTAVSFISEVDGEEVEFGVSGKLYNSDLIMYDRAEGNYWQQATGEAIVGPAARRDEYLEMISTTTTTWEQWKTEYPNTLVLSRETGFRRDYDVYPYGTYEENGEIFFGVQNSDEAGRLHPKDIVYGILVDGEAKAYTDEAIIVGRQIDEFSGISLEIMKTAAGEVSFTNTTTGEEIVPLRGFWFAWIAFYPETELLTTF